MFSSHLRITALALLLVSLISFSGTAQAGLLLFDTPAPHDSCCLPDHTEPAGDPSPCSSPECQCLGCSGALLVAPLPVSDTRPATVARFRSHPGMLLPGFDSPIDRPPQAR